jgi:hypothetical protein
MRLPAPAPAPAPVSASASAPLRASAAASTPQQAHPSCASDGSDADVAMTTEAVGSGVVADGGVGRVEARVEEAGEQRESLGVGGRGTGGGRCGMQVNEGGVESDECALVYIYSRCFSVLSCCGWGLWGQGTGDRDRRQDSGFWVRRRIERALKCSSCPVS